MVVFMQMRAISFPISGKTVDSEGGLAKDVKVIGRFLKLSYQCIEPAPIDYRWRDSSSQTPISGLTETPKYSQIRVVLFQTGDFLKYFRKQKSAMRENVK
jgi:hypothetical protein